MKKMIGILCIVIILCSVVVVLPGAAASGGKIAFQSDPGFGNEEIYIMNTDGSAQTRLTFSTAENAEPALSPDGTKIAFQSRLDYSLHDDEIYVMNAADGSGVTRLTTNPAYDSTPAWSPDGSKIAFESNRDGNSELYTMNAADGSGVKRLTINMSVDLFPAWSPDGTKIAFTSNRDGNYRIYVMNSDGSKPEPLEFNLTDGYPAWSPDGTKIAFEAVNGTGNYDIYILNADRSGAKRLTSNLAREGHPTWSTDGAMIAFESGSQIYVMNADGSGQTSLPYKAVGAEPDWGRIAQDTLDTDVLCGTEGTSAFPVILDLPKCGDNQVTVRWNEYSPPSGTSGSPAFYNVWKAKDFGSGPVAPFTFYEPVVQKGIGFKMILGPVETSDIIVMPIVKFPIYDGGNVLIPVCYNYVKVTSPNCPGPEPTPSPAPAPEFPSTILPATMIIGFLGAVLIIQRTREQ